MLVSILRIYANTYVSTSSQFYLHIEGILPKGPYLPSVSMAGRALLAGYPRYMMCIRGYIYSYTRIQVSYGYLVCPHIFDELIILVRTYIYLYMFVLTLQWRHNGPDGVSNHQHHDCLLIRLFGRRSKKISKHRVTGICAGKSPVTGEFSTQRASNAENVSIWWRHHEWWITFATTGLFQIRFTF